MRFQLVYTALLASSLVLVATGCTLENSAIAPPTQGLSLAGSVHGGQQAISGSHVYLMQASAAGYGTASTSLLTSGSGADSVGTYVLSDTFGGFSVTGQYTCTPNNQVYLLALGGNPGLARGTNNAALALMANLGNCPASGSLAAQDPFILMNEVSTVASVYSVAGFMSSPVSVSSSSTPLAAVGLANAFASTSNLINLGSGTALAMTPAGNGTLPQAALNTLANIIATCINTDGTISAAKGPPSPAPATTCYTLLNNAKNGSVTPADTVTAVLNIAHNPSANITNLYNLSAAAAPFQPALASAPNDFTLQVSYTGAGIENSGGSRHAHNVAVDASGDIWTADSDAGAISELSPLGAVLSGPTGFSGGGLNFPYGVAIDTAGKVWIPNLGASSVSVLTNAGTVSAGSPFHADLGPIDVALDAGGNVWVANRNKPSISKLSNTGVTASGSPFSNNSFNSPFSIAVQASGNVWITDNRSGDASAFTNAGGSLANSPFILDPSQTGPDGNAIDALGNVWMTDAYLNQVFKLDSGGNPVTNSPFSNPGLSQPHAIALDGVGTAWVTDLTTNALVNIAADGTSLSGSKGYATTDLATPDSVAVDGAGNVWYTTVTTQGNATANDTMREIIGAAAPVVTPLAAGVKNSTLATRP